RTFEARAEIPVVPRPTQRFDLRALPDDEVVFHLPDLGCLRVDLVGAEQLPISHEGSLSLRPSPDPLQSETTNDNRYWVHVDTGGGWPVLVPVPLGKQYE